MVIAEIFKDGKVLFEVSEPIADVALHEKYRECVVLQLDRPISAIQSISDELLLELVKEAEEAARPRFGADFKVVEFVLVGE